MAERTAVKLLLVQFKQDLFPVVLVELGAHDLLATASLCVIDRSQRVRFGKPDAFLA